MRSNHKHALHQAIPALVASCLLLVAGGSKAADVVVRVSGLKEPLGQVGCSLFAGAVGFPMDSARSRVIWQSSDVKGVSCLFTDVAEGSYAVSIGHDLNGNKSVDTNFLGVPIEQWGVSNNVRPSLRAPRFDEAMFKIGAGVKEVTLDIKVAK
jgi:uncharacterized protein (DUF2141 family)